mmetsp:Transcript_1703/g.3865  ORF Transcript_1703/g.3865 Transcript_1703/m.3865 type:complete len:227 (-) Transcript_1703:213-893(-)
MLLSGGPRVFFAGAAAAPAAPPAAPAFPRPFDFTSFSASASGSSVFFFPRPPLPPFAAAPAGALVLFCLFAAGAGPCQSLESSSPASSSSVSSSLVFVLVALFGPPPRSDKMYGDTRCRIPLLVISMLQCPLSCCIPVSEWSSLLAAPDCFQRGWLSTKHAVRYSVASSLAGEDATRRESDPFVNHPASAIATSRSIRCIPSLLLHSLEMKIVPDQPFESAIITRL